MIYPVKIYNKHGELINEITTEQLQTERDNAAKKLNYRERFNIMVKPKKQKTGKVPPGKRNAAPEVKRPRNPVQSGRNRTVDGQECQKIAAKTHSIFNKI
jgi:hypothetical protein